MFPAYSNTIDNSRSESIQALAHGKVGTTAPITVNWLAQAGIQTGVWWSPRRDLELRQFWKKSDHLSGAIYNMLSKLVSVEFSIVPRDMANKDDVEFAGQLTETIRATSQFGDGWSAFLERFVGDLLTQDNGAFAEIIGPGSPTGPMTGQPIAVAHLDASRCQRTSDPEFPVLYRDIDGKMYKMHYSRVMFTSQMTSPIREMNGVGFCAVSRCMSVAQTLIDILMYKQEKLGSRPHRAILITQGGLDPKDVADAFQLAENSMDSQGLSRYSKVVVAGSSSIETADLKVVELSQLPDGFDEKAAVELGMGAIALAFGMDALELFPNLTTTTRQGSMVQHMKQRQRGPGQIFDAIENLFNYKFVPPRFKLSFSYQDEAQDRQTADTANVRAQYTNLSLLNGTLEKRTARQKMVVTGDIDDSQFQMMEMADGRNEDGTDILNMFYSPNAAITPYQKLGVKDPLDFTHNDAQACATKADAQILKLRKDISTSTSNSTLGKNRVDAIKMLAALIKIKQIYLYIMRSGAMDEISKMIAADEAHSMIDSQPELGQDIITKTQSNQLNNSLDPNAPQAPTPDNNPSAMPGKPGPAAGLARPGRMMNNVGPGQPGQPRDLMKPRAVDTNPNAKGLEVGEEETIDPF